MIVKNMRGSMLFSGYIICLSFIKNISRITYLKSIQGFAIVTKLKIMHCDVTTVRYYLTCEITN